MDSIFKGYYNNLCMIWVSFGKIDLKYKLKCYTVQGVKYALTNPTLFKPQISFSPGKLPPIFYLGTYSY